MPTGSDWLLEYTEVESAPLSAERRILLSFLLFCGLMEGKYALICAMDTLKIQMVVHIFSRFALFAELNSSASC